MPGFRRSVLREKKRWGKEEQTRNGGEVEDVKKRKKNNQNQVD